MNEKITSIFDYENVRNHGVRVDDNCNLAVVLDMRAFDGTEEPAVGCTGEAGYLRGFVPLSDLLKLAAREFPEMLAQAIKDEGASESLQLLLSETEPEETSQETGRYS